MLLNVGSGGGAAPAAAAAGGAGAAAGGAAPAEEVKPEEKEEGTSTRTLEHVIADKMCSQRKKNPTKIWALVFSTKWDKPTIPCLCHFAKHVTSTNHASAKDRVPWEDDLRSNGIKDRGHQDGPGRAAAGLDSVDFQAVTGILRLKKCQIYSI